METLQTGTRASSAFYLSFRRWCIASRSASACAGGECKTTTRALSTSSTDRSERARSVQNTFAERATSSLLDQNVFAGFGHAVPATGSNSRRHYSRSRILQSAGQRTSKLDNDLRHALRTLTRPCVVVTASVPGSNTWTGATLSSFDTISLKPVPQVSFNIKVPSRTYDAFSQSGDVCIHILSASPEGALIADMFTKRYDDSSVPFGLLQKAGCTFTRGKNETAPKLYLEGGVLARLVCRKDERSQEVDVGDHKLCTLTVTHVEHTTSGDASANQHALAYGQRDFRSLGSAITPGLSSELERVVENKQDLDDADIEPAFHSGTHTRTNYTSRPSNVLTNTRAEHAAPARMASSGFHTTSLRLSTVSTRMNPAPRMFVPIEKIPPPDTPVSPGVMQQTVSDFLCHSQTRPAPRTSQLRDARRLGQIAYDRLRKDNVAKRLTTEERQELADISTGNERFIARRLAQHAANDLQDMLDTNHVSASRVQYIEKCIEAGQAALLREAKDFAAGRPRTGFSKAHLPDNVDSFEELDTHMRTVLMRLRDLYEEEDMD